MLFTITSSTDYFRFGCIITIIGVAANSNSNNGIKAGKFREQEEGMSWAGPEDIFLSTSLASYLDTNAVLENALERIIVGDLYCDIPLGLYVIRGENVVLIGELDPEREELPANMIHVSATEIKRAQKAERDATDLKGSMRKRMEFLDLE